MIYRALNGRKAVRCDVCGATDSSVLECWWPYTTAALERFDRKRDSTLGGQYYDACGDCRQVAGTIRQRFTDQRGVRQILREGGVQARRTAAQGV